MADIASLGIRIDSSQAVTATSNLNQLTNSGRAAEQSAGNLETSWSQFSKTIITLNQGLQVAGRIFGTMKRVAGELTGEFYDASGQSIKLSSALRATGNQVNYSTRELAGMAREMQYMTGISDNAVTSTQALMTTFTQIGHEIFPLAIDRAADMSVMFGQDLSQSAIQLGTALNDPITGIGRLRRIGISFTEAQKASIEQFMEQNDIMSAQKVILDELNVEFGGVAVAMGSEGKGAADRFRSAMGDLKEEGGRAIDDFITPLRTGVTNLVEKFVEGKALAREFREAISEGDDDISAEKYTKEYERLVGAIGITIQQQQAWRDSSETAGDVLDNALNILAEGYDTTVVKIAEIAEAEGLVTTEQLKQATLYQESLAAYEEEQRNERERLSLEQQSAEEAERKAAAQAENARWSALSLEHQKDMADAISKNSLKALIDPVFDEAEANLQAFRRELNEMVDEGFGFRIEFLESNTGGIAKLINLYPELFAAMMNGSEEMVSYYAWTQRNMAEIDRDMLANREATINALGSMDTQLGVMVSDTGPTAEMSEETQRLIEIRDELFSQLETIDRKEQELGKIYDGQADRLDAVALAIDQYYESGIQSAEALDLLLRLYNSLNEEEAENLTIKTLAGDLMRQLVERQREYNTELTNTGNLLDEAIGVNTISDMAEASDGIKEMKEAIANIGMQAARQGIDMLIDSFHELGEAIADANGKSADFGEVFANLGVTILEALPGILVQIAQAMVSGPQASTMWPLALGLLISAGVINVGAGYASEAVDATYNAHGNAYGGGRIIPFARGGAFTNSIVDRPTMFSMSGGNLGVMGEKTPEVIAPLFRSQSGDLGVKSAPANVSIRVENHSDAQVSVRTEQTPNGEEIVMLIESAVNRGFNEGKFDGAMRNNFGTARRGIA